MNFKATIAAAAVAIIGAANLPSPAQAAVVTEDLYFNYFISETVPFTPPGAVTSGAPNRVLVGSFSYDDAAFEQAGDEIIDMIFAAPGESYDPNAPDANPLESLVVSVQLLGIDYVGPNPNPVFTHQQDIDYEDDPRFPQLTFSFDDPTETYVPTFLDFIVEPGSPNGGGELLALTGFGGFNTFDQLQEIASFDANVIIQPVPVPAALPLLAGGLGLFGLMGWRRKRKIAQA